MCDWDRNKAYPLKCLQSRLQSRQCRVFDVLALYIWLETCYLSFRMKHPSLYESCPASPQPPSEGQVHQPFPGPALLPADLSLSKDDTGFFSHFTWISVREGRRSFWLSFVFLSVHSQELCGCLPQRISDSDKQKFWNPSLIQSHSGNSPKVKESVMAMHLPSGILFPFTQPQPVAETSIDTWASLPLGSVLPMNHI